jgi:hypothetical protein
MLVELLASDTCLDGAVQIIRAHAQNLIHARKVD